MFEVTVWSKNVPTQSILVLYQIEFHLNLKYSVTFQFAFIL